MGRRSGFEDHEADDDQANQDTDPSGCEAAPIADLPDWVQSIANFVPTYWAMEGFLDVILRGEGVAVVTVPTLILLGFTAVFTLVAAAKFRSAETKIYVG